MTAANEESALSLSAANGRFQVAQLLLKHGADPSHTFKVRWRHVFSYSFSEIEIPKETTNQNSEGNDEPNSEGNDEPHFEVDR